MFFKNLHLFFKNLFDLSKVPLTVHEEALALIENQGIENRDLKEQNRLLRRSIKQKDDEIKYLKEERAIDQSFIVDLLAKILRYTDVPKEEIEILERGVDVAKALARRNYGR